jgi:hypothetical protein
MATLICTVRISQSHMVATQVHQVPRLKGTAMFTVITNYYFSDESVYLYVNFDY